jgi:hypothetical protein
MGVADPPEKNVRRAGSRRTTSPSLRYDVPHPYAERLRTPTFPNVREIP